MELERQMWSVYTFGTVHNNDKHKTDYRISRMERIYMWLINSLLFFSLSRGARVCVCVYPPYNVSTLRFHTLSARSLYFEFVMLFSSIKLPQRKEIVMWRKTEHVGNIDSTAGHMFGIWRGNFQSQESESINNNEAMYKENASVSRVRPIWFRNGESSAVQSGAEQRAGDSVACDGPNTIACWSISCWTADSNTQCCYWRGKRSLDSLTLSAVAR